MHKYSLLYLSILAFLLIGSFALTLIPGPPSSVVFHTASAQRSRLTDSQLPSIAALASFPTLSAQGVIAIDLDSAVVLYEKNPDMQLLPASTTKIMTALVAMDQFSPSDVITVGRVSVVGQKMNLVYGEQLTVRSLLDGLLIYSANDAAEVLAANYPGGREEFMATMNQKARQYHMDNTHFTNPVGLDAQNHYSSVRDLVRLSSIAMQHPLFAQIVGTKTKTVTSVDGKIIHKLTNLNQLLGSVEGVLGVKTGWTEGARENLVTLVDRGDRKILIALLGSQDRFGETKQLINWIFENTSWNEIDYNPETTSP